MLDKNISDFLGSLLAEHLATNLSSMDISGVGGGSINDTYRLVVNKTESFFLKINEAAKFPNLFEREKEGLIFLGQQECIRIPAVLFCGKVQEKQVLVLEWIQPGQRPASFWERFGRQLAELHHKSSPEFGFLSDNFMGALPQINGPLGNWPDFFALRRLQPQTELAIKNGLITAKHALQMETICNDLSSYFPAEAPSLLHGDLWCGNFMADDQSNPVLIDPAVYFGHRSVDLAMTTLFGGFDKIFYDSYNHHFPFPSNYREQWDICNLYPLLIHLNLFGPSYLGDITAILKRFA
jgi:protein-ribulosamine 3-kinase